MCAAGRRGVRAVRVVSAVVAVRYRHEIRATHQAGAARGGTRLRDGASAAASSSGRRARRGARHHSTRAGPTEVTMLLLVPLLLQVQAAQPLHALFDEEWEYETRAAPEAATARGDNRFNDRLDDRS